MKTPSGENEDDASNAQTALENLHKRCLMPTEEVVWQRCARPPATTMAQAVGSGCARVGMIVGCLFFAMVLFIVDIPLGGAFMILLAFFVSWASLQQSATAAVTAGTLVLSVTTNGRAMTLSIGDRRHIRSIYPEGLRNT